MSPVQFRKATSQDQTQIVQFQMAMAQETENLSLNLQECTQGVRAVFIQPHLGTYYVAESNGELKASLLVIPEWSDWRNGVIWWIHSVYVVPSARRQGVFSKFYEYIQEQGKSQAKIRGIRLYVDKRNQSAQAVYQKLGMNHQHYDLFEQML